MPGSNSITDFQWGEMVSHAKKEKIFPLSLKKVVTSSKPTDYIWCHPVENLLTMEEKWKIRNSLASAQERRYMRSFKYRENGLEEAEPPGLKQIFW